MQARPITTPTTAHAVLREQTRAAHERLHELQIFRALLTGTLAKAGYGCLLARLHAYYERVDAVIQVACIRFRAHELDYQYAARAPLFVRDLDLLGAIDAHGREPHDATAPLPVIDSAAGLAGALYVIEGSLLGGATLDRAARRLLAREDGADTQGRQYWAWCGEVGTARWLRTTTLIERWVDTPMRLRQATVTARATFERLHGWLTPLAERPC